MTIDLHFDGSSSGRGRNGWFQIREGVILTDPANGHLWVDFYAHRRGKMPPICLSIYHPEELRTLIGGLAKALAQMTAKED
jgi:hypothetical protein